MILEMTKAAPKPVYRFELEFSNGLTEQVDLSNALRGKVLEPLNDIH